MSSLQKFHRRTQLAPIPEVWPATTIGQGNATNGYWLGTAGDGTSKMIVAPKSTEQQLTWGSYGIYRGGGLTSYTAGLTNTNTLAGFGQTAHPAAYYAKNLTTGGYNTWYLPARYELRALYTNSFTRPFSDNNSFNAADYWTSTEGGGTYSAVAYTMSNGTIQQPSKKATTVYVRAIRRL